MKKLYLYSFIRDIIYDLERNEVFDQDDFQQLLDYYINKLCSIESQYDMEYDGPSKIYPLQNNDFVRFNAFRNTKKLANIMKVKIGKITFLTENNGKKWKFKIDE